MKHAGINPPRAPSVVHEQIWDSYHSGSSAHHPVHCASTNLHVFLHIFAYDGQKLHFEHYC